MKTLSKTLAVVSLSLFSVVPAFAAHNEHRPTKDASVAERLAHQQQRIHQGVEKHQLTRKEVKALRRQQRDIRHLAHRFYEDGHLSKKERRLLNRELNESSRLIKRYRQNDLGRYVKLHQRFTCRDSARRL